MTATTTEIRESTTKPKHTPGSWELDDGAVYTNNKTTLIATLYRKGPWTDSAEREADGQLIAAAPEMYDALEGLLSVLRKIPGVEEHPDVERAEATALVAVYKARGVSV